MIKQFKRFFHRLCESHFLVHRIFILFQSTRYSLLSKFYSVCFFLLTSFRLGFLCSSSKGNDNCGLGDGRVKMPLSPTVVGSQQRPFGLGHGLGGSSIELVESPLYPSTSSVSHSFSSNNLGQMQFDSGGMASFWSPHRSQMRLQSRRSQSREDLSSSLADAHLVKI